MPSFRLHVLLDQAARAAGAPGELRDADHWAHQATISGPSRKVAVRASRAQCPWAAAARSSRGRGGRRPWSGARRTGRRSVGRSFPGRRRAAGRRGLVLGEAGTPAAFAAAGPCGGQAVHRVGHDELALELGEHGQHSEHGPALHCGGVDALLDHVQSDAALAQVGAQGHQVQDGAGESVEPGDLQRVAGPQQLQHEVELRPGCLRATRGVDVDIAPLHPVLQERVDLMIGILVHGRDPSVAEEHTSEST